MLKLQLVTCLLVGLALPTQGGEDFLDNTSLKGKGKPVLEKKVLVEEMTLKGEGDHDIMGYGKDLEVDNTKGQLNISLGDSNFSAEESDYVRERLSALQYDEDGQRYLIRQENDDKPGKGKWFVVQEVIVNVDNKAGKARVWARTIENETKKKKRKLGSWYEVGDFRK